MYARAVSQRPGEPGDPGDEDPSDAARGVGPGRHAAWERVKDVFLEAVELPVERRAAFLERATHGDADLRREVESLLAAHEEEGLRDPTLPSLGETSTVPDGDLPPPPASGTTLGRFRVLRSLGRGGMGEVLLAHDPLLERDVALKLLPAALASHPEARARLLREARAAAGLGHPHIATIYEIGEVDGRDVIAQEAVPGKTLRALRRDAPDGRPLDAPGIVRLAHPVAEALTFAHERGVVHRDVKTSNVLVTPEGVVKLVDFGLATQTPARRSAPDADATRAGHVDAGHPPPDDDAPPGTQPAPAGSIEGTPTAMSPEQAAGREVGPPSDVFSLGCLLFELATGRPPFRGRDAAAVLDAVVRADAPDLRRLRPDLDPALARLVDACLRKEPAARPSMREVHRALVDLEREVDARAGTLARPLAGVLSLLVVGVLAWFAIGGPASSGDASPTTAARTAVVCFDERPDAAPDDPLPDMLARLLTAELAAGRELDVLSQQRLSDVARREGLADGHVPRDRLGAVARAADLGTLAVARLEEIDGRPHASVEIQDVATGRVVGGGHAFFPFEGEHDVFELAMELGRQVRQTLGADDLSPDERRALTAQLTSSVEAYRAYVRGQQALDRGSFDEAARAFEEATLRDPAFALAHFRLALTLTWTGDAEPTALAIERARAFRDKLPDDVRALMDVTDLYAADRQAAALPGLLSILERDPDNREALFLVGEAYTHSATRADAREALATYRRLYALEPEHAPLYDHLLNALLRLGRHEEARGLLDEMGRREPENLPALRGMLALWEGDPARAAESLGDVLQTGLLRPWGASAEVRRVVDAEVDALVAELDGVHGTYRVLELDLRGVAKAEAGRLDEAAELFRRAAGVVVPEPPTEDGYITSTRNAARHRLAELHLLRGEPAAATALVDEALGYQPESPRCLLAAVRVAVRVGDLAAARRHLATLARLEEAGLPPTVDLYADGARAELALARGDAATARALLAPHVGAGLGEPGARLMEDWYSASDSVGPWLRDALARACFAGGDREAALAVLDGLLGSGLEALRHPFTRTRALSRRGRLAQDLGRGGEPDLEAFLDRWGEGCPDLPEVIDARARLGR